MHCNSVRFQATLCSESPGAMGTLVGLLTGMGANVLIQFPFRGKESATIYTLVKTCFTASSLV